MNEFRKTIELQDSLFYCELQFRFNTKTGYSHSVILPFGIFPGGEFSLQDATKTGD